MFDLDKWKEIWATLRSNRLRTFLTAFGVFWGILMLMLMLGFGSSMQEGSRRQMKGMATNLLFVWGQQTTESYDGLPPGRGVRFTTADIDILRRLPGVEHLAPRLQLGGWMNNFSVGYGSKTGAFTVMADYPEFKHIVAFEYEAGRFINERDIAEKRKVAVIGANVKQQLFGDEDPIGKYLRISGVYFQVIGVTKTLRGGREGDRDATTLFVPFTTLKTAFKMGDRVGFFALTAKAGTDGKELEKQVKDALKRKHRVAPTDDLAIGSFNMFEMFKRIGGLFFMMSFIAKRCVTSLPGCSLPDRTTFSSIGVVTVSTSRVVSEIFVSQSFSRCSSTGLPWTPTLAMCPPAATMSWQISKVPGTPTASMATSTPAPSVNFIT